MTNKIVSLSKAVEQIPDGASIGLPGFSIARNAVAFAHEVIRQGKKHLTLSSCAAGIDAELMVAAGAVDHFIYSAGTLDKYGLVATINRFIDEGKLTTEEHSMLSMELRYLAGSIGISYIPCNSLLGSDVLRTLLETVPDKVKESTCPFTGEKQVLLRALQPDIGVVVANYADEEGNTVVEGPYWNIKEMAHASKKILVIAEQIVPQSFILQRPEMTMIAGALVDTIVECPWSAYPTSIYHRYDYDDKHLRMYTQANRDAQKIKEYLEEYVYGVKDHFEFLEKAVGYKALMKQMAIPHKGY
jgi:acyl CoA:acetate/3-ketoacid CoA transferase alpha subunit